MIRVDVQQGTPEWHESRAGIPTASRFHRIVTPAKGEPSKQARAVVYELAAEWMLGPADERDLDNPWMKRGRDQESEVRRWYEFQYDVPVEQVGFCLTDDRLAGGSPDGFVGDDGVIEIKTPSAGQHIRNLVEQGQFATDHRPQVQGLLWVCERQWCDLISANPVIPMAVVRCERDEEYIERLAEAVRDVSRQVQGIIEDVWYGQEASDAA